MAFKVKEFEAATATVSVVASTCYLSAATMTQATIGGVTQYDVYRVATAAALPACTSGGAGILSADAVGQLSADGVPLTTGDKILVKNQVSGKYNGTYTVTSAGSAAGKFVLTRCDLIIGTTVCADVLTITSGSLYSGRAFRITNIAGAKTVGTDALTFAPVVVNTTPEVFNYNTMIASTASNWTQIVASGFILSGAVTGNGYFTLDGMSSKADTIDYFRVFGHHSSGSQLSAVLYTIGSAGSVTSIASGALASGSSAVGLLISCVTAHTVLANQSHRIKMVATASAAGEFMQIFGITVGTTRQYYA